MAALSDTARMSGLIPITMTSDQAGGIFSTEVSDISCVMRRFNEPLAPRKISRYHA